MATPLEWALAYVERLGWPVFPRPNGRWTGSGWQDATRDLDRIREWWQRWPHALIAMPTGATSGIVVLDIDVKGGKNGWHAIEDLEVDLSAETAIALSPNNGVHYYFALQPGQVIRSSGGELGQGLDVLSDKMSVALPTPNYRYRWDKNPGNSPPAPAPQWLHVPEKAPPVKLRKPILRCEGLSPYADQALGSACLNIRHAENGQQHLTLRKEAFSIGTLAGAGGIPEELARAALVDAGLGMTEHNQRKWDRKAVERVVNQCFDAGCNHPRK
jgi:hypothetical protein